jgi:hypothetical protein
MRREIIEPVSVEDKWVCALPALQKRKLEIYELRLGRKLGALGSINS